MVHTQALGVSLLQREGTKSSEKELRGNPRSTVYTYLSISKLSVQLATFTNRGKTPKLRKVYSFKRGFAKIKSVSNLELCMNRTSTFYVGRRK